MSSSVHTMRPSHLATTPADDAEEWSKDHLVCWLRLPCATLRSVRRTMTPRNGWRTTPVLKSPRMFRDAEEWWSFDHSAASSKDHSGARANFASKRA